MVKDTVESMNSILEDTRSIDPNTLSDQQLISSWRNTEENTKIWYTRLLEMKDGLEILLKCSDGTKYSHFHDEWLERIIHGMSDEEVAHHCRLAGKLFDWCSAMGIPDV